jgi:hypothetical protein
MMLGVEHQIQLLDLPSPLEGIRQKEHQKRFSLLAIEQ